MAISLTHEKGRSIITSCQAIACNPYDGHTLKASLAMLERVSQIAVKETYVDKGYKGHEVAGSKVYISDQSKGITTKLKAKVKLRQAIKPHIEHMKQKVKLGLCR